MLLNPPPHSSGVKPPKIQPDLIPNHIAVVMDGNGRWAKERGYLELLDMKLAKRA